MINTEKWENLRAGHTAKEKIKRRYFYICPGDGNGDLLYNTCREIIDRDQNDEWAHKALEKVFICLDLGMRWTVEMNDTITLGEERRLHMTQDPWLLAYCCAIHLDRKDLIVKYKPSIKLFNLPDKWAWRRSLLNKPNLYWLWRLFPHTFLNNVIIKWQGKNNALLQDFVYVFYGYMDKAYLNNKQ